MATQPLALTGTTPVEKLKGVGPKLKEKLARLGLFVVRDLLLHLPARYEDRTQYVPLRQLRPGTAALFHGEIVEARVAFGQRRSLLINITDGSGFMQLRFFYFSRRQQQDLCAGAHLHCFGEPRFSGHNVEVVHPDYRVFSGELPSPEAVLTPVYPTTEGLGQARLRSLTAQARSVGWDGFEMPDMQLKISECIQLLHEPSADTTPADLAAAREGRRSCGSGGQRGTAGSGSRAVPGPGPRGSCTRRIAGCD